MINLGEIKSKKLKRMIEESFRFEQLEENEQKEMLEKMTSMSAEEQELAYAPFFEKENRKEDEVVRAREQAFEKLIEKVQEADKYIKKMINSEKEKKAQKEESEEEDILLRSLKEI